MPARVFPIFLIAVFAAVGPRLAGQGERAPGEPAKPADIRELKLRDWEPRSMMKAKATVLEKPMFPVIDIHNHLGGGKDFLTQERVQRYLTEMNEAGVKTVVNLDGGWGDKLKETLAALDKAHPGRFLTFALVDFDGFDEPEWSDRETKRLEEGFRAGAKGLKFHKLFGLRYKHKDGRLIAVDDPKLDPIWELCGKHQKPVVIHVADPAAFFTPLDRFNERWHELNEHPNWLFYGGGNPKREDLLDALHRVIAKHPNTTFINTHFGNNAEDLASVAEKLDKYPNMMVDIDARISELGRQPYAAQRFFLKYQDRVMFGTDTPPNREAFRIYYRFLETDDEYFDCSASHHRQGFWNIYGIHLPPEVLEKVYRKNAERIFGLRSDPHPGEGEARPEMHVPRTEDFEPNGIGDNPAWNKAEWTTLKKRGGKLPYETKVKALYSKTGMYFLMDGTDRKISANETEDFADLWKQDCFEVYLWPDERDSLYLEYQISPLAKELILFIPNLDSKFLGWRPWHYEGERKTRKATSAVGAPTIASGLAVQGWRAEVFIPYALLAPLRSVPPQRGTRWRGNFYRMDYDEGDKASWNWTPVGPSFHEFAKFGTLVFE